MTNNPKKWFTNHYKRFLGKNKTFFENPFFSDWKIFIPIKNRDRLKAVSICVSGIGEIMDIFDENFQLQNQMNMFLEKSLPGPFTFIFKKNENTKISELLNQNNQYLGVRIPEDNLINQLCKLVNQPLALTSANLSGEKSPLEINDFQKIWPKLDLILDSGKILKSKEDRSGSSIVKFELSDEHDSPMVIRLIRKGTGYEQLLKNIFEFFGKDVKLLDFVETNDASSY